MGLRWWHVKLTTDARQILWMHGNACFWLVVLLGSDCAHETRSCYVVVSRATNNVICNWREEEVVVSTHT